MLLELENYTILISLERVVTYNSLFNEFGHAKLLSNSSWREL
jgi:hypothetical protein